MNGSASSCLEKCFHHDIFTFNVVKTAQSLLIIFFNALLLFYIIWYRAFRQLCGAFALSISVANLGVGIESVWNSVAYFAGTLKTFYIANHWMFKVCLYASLGTNLACPCVQLRAVLVPFKAKLWGLKNTVILLVTVWSVAIVIGSFSTSVKYSALKPHYSKIKIVELSIYTISTVTLICTQVATFVALRHHEKKFRGKCQFVVNILHIRLHLHQIALLWRSKQLHKRSFYHGRTGWY